MSYGSGINSPNGESAPEKSAGKRPSLRRRLLRIGLGVVIGFAALFGGTLVLIHALGENERRYEGTAVSQWLTQVK